ncbi:MAG: hypothetical protein BYD32DRAFT_309535 [Podila humilis]|nr:MAG: hypothetical protein BYD32DRAFT_309535 [Podila humilis]
MELMYISTEKTSSHKKNNNDSCGVCTDTTTEPIPHMGRQYPCQHCNSVFDTKEELDTHHTVHLICEEGCACYKKKQQSIHTSHTQDTSTASSSNIGASLAGTDISSLISNLHRNNFNANSHSITFHSQGDSGVCHDLGQVKGGMTFSQSD